MYYFSGPQTIKCCVLEVQEGLYSNLVVQDLATEKFLLLTVFPNWQGEIPKKGDIGYIEFEFVKAGVDKYFDKAQSQHFVYSNTYMFFKTYVKDTGKTSCDKIII